ncbi:MAG TPA: preprotein translocase subunit SecG [Candidatus Limnocylindria bacterium]|nr:preprotein translocase subunit SecG [Candidatus Limnocylindria bacterium]
MTGSTAGCYGTRPFARAALAGHLYPGMDRSMYGLLLALHIIICFSLIVVVLLQSGKGGGLAGGAFGGTAQTVFGGRGATDFVTRATMILGGAFFMTSLVLALMSSGVGRPARSLLQEEAQKATTTAPRQLPGQAPPSGQTPAGQPPAGQAPVPSGQAPPAPGSGSGSPPAQPPAGTP